MSVQDTSRAAYDAIKASLTQRESIVWEALARCVTPPTAYELYERMKQEGAPIRDINDVRPRLTEMNEIGRHCVEDVGKRACTITGRTVMTWRVKVGHPPQPRTTQPHDLNVMTPNAEKGRLW